MAHTYPYPRPTVTVDAAVLRPGDGGGLEILLIERGHEPFAGRHALPGGFLEMEEEPATGAARELQEETGLAGLDLAPLFAAGRTGRDPRARCITLVYGTLVDGRSLHPEGGDDARQAGWFPCESPPAMAFDHADLLREIGRHLRWQARTALVGRRIWPAAFPGEALEELHRSLLGPTAEPAVARGLRLGLLQPAEGPGTFRFAPPPPALPDWQELVW